MSFCHNNLNNLLRFGSRNPDFNLAGIRLETSYVERSLMRPLTPPPRSFTPPSLFPAAEVFEDVPQGDGTSTFSLLDVDSYRMVASEAFSDPPQSPGKSMCFC